MRKINSFLTMLVFCLFVSSNASFAQANYQDQGLDHDFPDSLGKLMDLDTKFSALSVEKGAAVAFQTYMAEGAISPVNGGEILHGLPAILRDLETAGIYTLKWTPLGGNLPDGSKMGYTYGRFIYETTDYEGNIKTSHGKYVSIWHKQNNGQWKIVFDMGNTNPPQYHNPFSMGD
jgi:ketosteroid isomerase-like protein